MLLNQGLLFQQMEAVIPLTLDPKQVSKEAVRDMAGGGLATIALKLILCMEKGVLFMVPSSSRFFWAQEEAIIPTILVESVAAQ